MASIQSSTDPRIAKPEMSLRDRLTGLIAGGLDFFETDARRKAFPNISQSMAKELTPIAENLPIVGQAVAAEDVGEAYKSGSKFDMALAALGLIPGFKAERKAAEGVGEVASMIGHNGGPPLHPPRPPPTRTMEHGVSSNKLRRPLEEMTATHELAPGPPLLPQKEFNLNDVPIGSTFVPLVGDRTLAGKLLTGVNETKFENPVHQQGGSDFTRGPQMQEEGAYWASHPGVISNMRNRTRSAQESGDPVFAAHVAMGPQSGDFSLQTTDAILEQLKHAKLSPEAIQAFNDAMAAPWTKDFPNRIENFPGVDKLSREWSAGASADERKKLAKLMDQGRFQKLGFPDIGSTRKAITEPTLLNAKTGDTGHNIVRVGPEQVQAITDPKIPHSDYASQLVRGSHEGTITGGVPWNEFWSDWFTARGKPNENPSHTGKAFSTQDVRQKVTQEWKDRMMKLAEFKKTDEGRRLGLAGATGLGLITAAQAKEEFGYGTGNET